MARESFAETFAEAALQALPGVVVVLDQDGRIQRWAGTAEELTGYTEDDVRGEPVRRVLAGPSWQELQELTALQTPTELVARLKRREGSPLPVALSLAPVRDGPGGGPLEATVLLLHPLGPWAGLEGEDGEQPHWEWQRALGATARRLVAEAGHDLNAIDDTQQLAGLLIEQARQLLPGTEVLIGMVPAERQKGFLILAGTGSWGRTMVGREIPRTEYVAGRSLEQSRPIETMRLQPDRGEPEGRNGSGHRGSALRDVLNTVRLVPFRAPRPLPDGRQLLGVVGWYRRTDSPFSPHERRLIDEFSSLVGAAIQRTELRRCAADAASRLQVGVGVAIDLASSLKREDVTQRLIRGAVEAVGAELGAVLEVDGQTAVVEQTTADDPPLTLGLRFPLDAVRGVGGVDGESPHTVEGDRRILLDAIERRQAVTAEGFQYVVGSDSPAVSRAKHVLLLPIVVGDGVTAVLMTGRATDRPFYDHEVATARLIGNVAGLAMRNARLFSDTVAASRAKSD
ncbi:MAG: PAS domain S-box protein, partial [Candidatus Dormibacteraeota bacterium]|nr:PAS domain S-box protein [Candidatus Dormibacteraeota bacterium]MBO0762905.1 PAS domain S-box protein [Candidatus Dormibacteraeota bacterium]